MDVLIFAAFGDHDLRAAGAAYTLVRTSEPADRAVRRIVAPNPSAMTGALELTPDIGVVAHFKIIAIVAGTAFQLVEPQTAGEVIVTIPALQHILTGIPIEQIMVITAFEYVTFATTADNVIAVAAT